MIRRSGKIRACKPVRRRQVQVSLDRVALLETSENSSPNAAQQVHENCGRRDISTGTWVRIRPSPTAALVEAHRPQAPSD